MADEPQKWPWSITDREFGALEQEIKEIRHDLRNLKFIVDASGVGMVAKEEINDLREHLTKIKHYVKAAKLAEETHKKFNEDLTKLKIKVYTAFSVMGIMAATIVWLVDVAFKIID